ncbi:protein adenylyltransferase SelO [Microvirga antarctica]|uniref:protein adenylyltransferase SelO n=1 Tax=Microvirga antarctica TaxID=2819233 RepID=UPI001B3104C4|nr:YdiU family protein [Microvirga antarctica]
MWTNNRYHEVSDRFFQPVELSPVVAPQLVLLNESLARDLGLDIGWLRSDEGVACLAGNTVLPGTRPVALAYAGHQFGRFVPVLGDGRALLLGEATDSRGARFEIQLKGSGRTPFSRGGDGRAALGPMLREYVVSEAMQAFGIPTTRSLAVLTTGEPVYRETVMPGAILVRVAESHVRVGTFQYFAARGDVDALRLLVEDVVRRSYPHLASVPPAEQALALLDAASTRHAYLVAAWTGVGFLHGVMNTDNVALSGETLDYGPCAFIDSYDPAAVFSSIDTGGRYAYGNQPHMAAWAMARLAEALRPLIADDKAVADTAAQGVVDRMAATSRLAQETVMLRKIGLTPKDPGAQILLSRLLGMMAEAHSDFTTTFTALGEANAADGTDTPFLAQLERKEASAWLGEWQTALRGSEAGASDIRATMRQANPLFIPRNHRIEQALEAAVQDGSLDRVENLLEVLRAPFDPHPRLMHLALPPEPHERVLQTFCGT